ncbi:malate dehydrogenase (quinone) [Acinetobacter qingfengensis]|uniref:Probable malate:quinone oxidoreductase n=1 Tax=Acinetobacter qingfengensis TaxID=1262585 RepID=A0A1E7R1R2_9GAMM|nr:malate dehydrogenase (quinone) [Acinetobacter qingfengensis]KAA8733176.1 malate dehydrogenase (quinone) [Acinetobacter qingfengensis]OEY93254.1 malate:quinone oxidoreductase [Acinetobacter qingfengensis]
MKKFLKYILVLIVLLLIALIVFLFRPVASKQVQTQDNEPVVDVVLVGGGIMSATLGTYLNELEPNWQIRMYERLDKVAQESSNGFNNAGTGHSGFMEMNYTEEKNGKMDVSKAENIAKQFEVAKQFWAYQVNQGVLGDPKTFINPVPHIAFVWGDNVQFLEKRYAAMTQSPLFKGMIMSEDPNVIKQWAPLVMQNRDPQQKVAATRMDVGSDVNYGSITTQLVNHLQKDKNFKLEVSSEVTEISQNQDKTWTVSYKNLKTGATSHVKTRFVFIGAGGAVIKLLQLTGLPEAQQYAGFPVGGEFLITDNPKIAAAHTAKVYGRADLGAPPMSVPHIDTRYIDGKKYVLFGPFATYSNKFLKFGSQLDLLKSTTNTNILPMATIGLENLDLVKYLIGQVMQSDEDRFAELKKYYPDADPKDWRLSQGGQRVQIIKKVPDQPAKLQFGTEIFASKDKTVTALLGASPGASTSPYIMLSLMEKAFPEQTKGVWNAKLHEIIHSYDQDLAKDPALLDQVRQYTSTTLGLHYTTPAGLLGNVPAASAPVAAAQ